MERKVYPLYYGGKLMPWAKGIVVKGGKGFVFLAGAEGIDPESRDIKMYESADDSWKVEVVEGIEAQTRLTLEKIKVWLEEMGSSLYNIVKLTCYIKVPPDLPDGVGNYPLWVKAHEVMNEFWKEHYPEFCWDNNPPNLDLIGVADLGAKGMLIEIAATAVISD